MPSADTSSLTSWPISVPFILCSCLIAPDRTSGIMLNGSGKNGYPCLYLDLKEQTIALLPLSMVLALTFFIGAFYEI